MIKQKQHNYDALIHLNPLVPFIFFIVTILLTCLILHPISIVLSIVNAIICISYQQGVGSLLKKIKYLLPTLVVTSVINPLFSHAGVTILWYFPDGNPLTLESILYGLYAGSLIVCMMLWFSYFHDMMTTDKFVYLFGKISPSLSLLFSMSLRFVPRFVNQLKMIQKAQETIGYSMTSGRLKNRMKNAVRVLSILLTWSLENAIDTSDSMKSRGYGIGKRTHFQIYTMSSLDKYCISLLILLSLGCFIGISMNAFHFKYFPTIQSKQTPGSFIAWILYTGLLSFPTSLNIWERYTWRKKLILT